MPFSSNISNVLIVKGEEQPFLYQISSGRMPRYSGSAEYLATNPVMDRISGFQDLPDIEFSIRPIPDNKSIPGLNSFLDFALLSGLVAGKFPGKP